MLRLPAVAGQFYPANPQELAAFVRRLTNQPNAQQKSHVKACLVPHAGYIYSGHVAGAVFAKIHIPRSVVILGVRHLPRGADVAITSEGAWRTPLGDVPVEEARLPQDPRAHAEEHSLEVELPFLQVALRSFALIPLAVGDAAPDEVASVIEQLWGGAETLIVVSSDLSHYQPYADAQRADAATAKEILALGRLTPDDACGAVPVNGLLLAAKRRGLRADLIDLRNSGDTAGDKKRVVGYGAFAFYER